MHGLGNNTEDQVPYSTKEISSSTALVIPTTAPEPVIDTAEEEGVCRICLVEDGRVMRMECKCKGGLALAHQECALKSNKRCDICKHVVQSLPRGAQAQQQISRFNRIGDYVFPVTVANSLAYFCLLEIVTVRQSGFIFTPIVVCVSILLGFMGSLTSSTLVWNKYLWVYAAFQFVCMLSSLFFINKFSSIPAGFIVGFPAVAFWVISIGCGLIIDCLAEIMTRKLQDSNQPHVSLV